MQTPAPFPAQREAPCAPAAPALTSGTATGPAPLFPPKDADAEARRRWLATSPWPEVVFASAGA